MKRSNRLVLVVGILLAVLAFVGVFFVLNQKSGPAQTTPPAHVVVAKRAIALGTAVQEGDVEQREIPASEAKPEYFQQPGDVIGQTARTDIAQGANLTVSMFAAPGQGALAQDLPEGKVGIAVRVDSLTGVGTLILPGDRVDLVATLKITPVTVTPVASAAPQIAAQDALSGDSTKLILQNLEVRAVLGASAGTVATTGTPGTDLGSAQQIVILAADPQQAEVIRFLQQEALTSGASTPSNNITLLLRSPKDKDAPAVETSGVILKTLIRDYGVLPPNAVEASLPPAK